MGEEEGRGIVFKVHGSKFPLRSIIMPGVQKVHPVGFAWVLESCRA